MKKRDQRGEDTVKEWQRRREPSFSTSVYFTGHLHGLHASFYVYWCLPNLQMRQLKFRDQKKLVQSYILNKNNTEDCSNKKDLMHGAENRY